MTEDEIAQGAGQAGGLLVRIGSLLGSNTKITIGFGMSILVAVVPAVWWSAVAVSEIKTDAAASRMASEQALVLSKATQELVSSLSGIVSDHTAQFRYFDDRRATEQLRMEMQINAVRKKVGMPIIPYSAPSSPPPMPDEQP